MFIETELGGSEAELAPFADGGDVAGLFQDSRRHGFDSRFHEAGGVLVGDSGWEGVATGISVIVTSAAVGEFIDMGCLEVVGSVSADAISAEIVCEDEDDVRLS